MSVTSVNDPAVEPPRLSRTHWPAVISIAVGTFAIITTEMLPIGMMTLIAPDLHISHGVSGQAMTLTSVTAFLAAPAIILAAGRLDRRLVMMLMMAVLLVANVLTVVATSLPLLLVARILVGISIGGFWAVGVSLAARLVPPQQVPRATSVIFSGVSIASVLGVPAGGIIGEHAGWRAAFASMAVLAVLVLAAVTMLLPALPSDERMTLAQLTGQFRHAPLRVGLLCLLLAITGHFAAYTYVTPVLRDVAGMKPDVIMTVLLVYGVAGIVGTFTAGAAIGRRLRAVTLGAMTFIALSTVLLPFLAAGGVVVSAALMVLWGLGYGAVPVAFQVWTLKASPQPEAGSALFTSLFQLAIAAGALLGGIGVDLFHRDVALWIGAALAVVCGLLAVRALGRLTAAASTAGG
jgi:predicted MFS family arabinose efflux permease